MICSAQAKESVCLLTLPTCPVFQVGLQALGLPEAKTTRALLARGAAERCGPAGEGAVKVRCWVEWLGAGGQSVGETALRARGVSHLFPSLLVTMIM